MIAFETTSAKNQKEWNSWNPTGLAPLTTRFEPLPACSTQWIQNPYNASNIRSGDGSFASWPADGGPAIRYDYSDYFASDYYARCRPYNQPQSQAYSPGICTKGQTVAGIRELLYDSTRRWMGWCCDRGRTMTTPGGDCQGNLSVPSTVLTNFTSTIVDQWDQTVTVMGIDVTTSFCTVSSGSRQCGGTTEIRRPTSLSSAAEFGPPFAIYWRASDLSLFPTDYASSLASVIDIPFGNSTADPSPPASGDGEDPGLSPGAIAGIAVGVAALIILGVVALLFLRRRRKRQTQEKQRLPTPEVEEMQGESTGLQHFVGGKWRAESGAGAELVEAGSRPVRLIPEEPVELDGAQRSGDR